MCPAAEARIAIRFWVRGDYRRSQRSLGLCSHCLQATAKVKILIRIVSGSRSLRSRDASGLVWFLVGALPNLHSTPTFGTFQYTTSRSPSRSGHPTIPLRPSSCVFNFFAHIHACVRASSLFYATCYFSILSIEWCMFIGDAQLHRWILALWQDHKNKVHWWNHAQKV